MSKPKRHHYIPQMLLKRFMDLDGILHVFDKGLPAKGVQKRTPRNVFVEGDRYTQIDDKGTKDVSVETKFLAPLEGKASPVLNKIVNAARRGDPPNLSPAEKDIWVKFFYIMFARVPDRLEIASDEVRQIVRARNNIASQSRLLNDLELSVQNDPETMDRHLKNGSIQNLQMSPSGEVYEFLTGCRFVVAVIRKPKPERSLIIGSNPVVRLSNAEQSYIADPSAEVWLPLARDVALSLCPGERDKVISVKDRHVKPINRSVYQKSTVIAGCSRELVQLIVGKFSEHDSVTLGHAT